MIPPLLQQFMQERGVTPDGINVLVQRDDRVVLRLHRPEVDLVVKLDVAPAAFDQEAAAMQRLAAIGLPVSTVVELQTGPPSLLMATWADGEPITSTTDPAVLSQVGSILRRIHSQPAHGPWSGHPSIGNWIAAWVAIVLPWWRQTGVDERIITALDDWLESIRPFLGYEHGTQMLFDGRPEHFLVDATNTLHLIDVADLQAGDPVMDLAVLELDAPGILEHVLTGYAPTPAELDRIHGLVAFYVALRALAGAEWQSRLGGNTSVIQRNLTIAHEMVERQSVDRR